MSRLNTTRSGGSNQLGLSSIGVPLDQLLGFGMMGLCFLIIATVPRMTTMVVPFLLVYGMSYFFIEFGLNKTTFVMPSELYPVSMRATGHGISAGVGKLGAFIGVFLFPLELRLWRPVTYREIVSSTSAARLRRIFTSLGRVMALYMCPNHRYLAVLGLGRCSGRSVCASHRP